MAVAHRGRLSCHLELDRATETAAFVGRFSGHADSSCVRAKRRRHSTPPRRLRVLTAVGPRLLTAVGPRLLTAGASVRRETHPMTRAQKREARSFADAPQSGNRLGEWGRFPKPACRTGTPGTAGRRHFETSAVSYKNRRCTPFRLSNDTAAAWTRAPFSRRILRRRARVGPRPPTAGGVGAQGRGRRRLRHADRRSPCCETRARAGHAGDGVCAAVVDGRRCARPAGCRAGWRLRSSCWRWSSPSVAR